MAKTEIEIDQILPGAANQLIGSNAAATFNEYKTLLGTTNQVSISNGIGSITLSTPQAIATTSTPTFASETLTATTNQLTLGITNTTTISATAPTSSRVYTLPDAGSAANMVLDKGNYTIGGTWTFSNAVTMTVPLAITSGGTGLSSIGSTSQELRVNSSGALYYGTNVINVLDYGATGNGSTDDTTFIQNAINAATAGQTVFFPVGTYKISSTLTLPQNITLKGCNALSSSTGTKINQTGSTPIFSLFVGTATDATIQNVEISGFHLTGGTNQIYAQNGGVWVNLNNIFFDGPSNAGLYMRGFNQQYVIRNCNFAGGGNYGIYLNQTGLQSDNVTTGTPLLWDKNSYSVLNFSSFAINGIYIVLPSGVGGSGTLKDIIVNFCTQDGIVFGGGLRNIIFDTVNSESNGYIGTTPTAPTTATTTASSPNVTVASGTGLVNGTVVTIQGAGTNGVDWYPTIMSGGGTTTLTMTTNAPTAVAGAELVNYLYSDIKIITSGGNGLYELSFINCVIGSSSNVAATRYAIDSSGLAGGGIVLQPSCVRPIYDPGAKINTQGFYGDLSVRRPGNFSTETFQSSYFGGSGGITNPRTQIVSPAGKDVVVGLLDSAGNLSGTVGNFAINRGDGSRAQVFQVSGTDGSMTRITGSTDGTAYDTENIGNGVLNITKTFQSTTSINSTTATTIMPASFWGNLCWVVLNSGGGIICFEMVMCLTDTTTPVVLGTIQRGGTAPARTYSVTGVDGNLQVKLASGSGYTAAVYNICQGAR